MNRIIESFRDKKFRYGAFSTLIAAVIIAVLIMTVTVFDQIDLRFDMTHDQFFTISEQTRRIIANIDENIRIYTLIPTTAGGEQREMTEILNQYVVHSDNIVLNNRDPILHRAFVNQFIEDGRDIPNNSVIVVGDRRSVVIPFHDMFIFEFDMFLGNIPVAFNIEPLVTNAISYVTREVVYSVFEIYGNNNVPLNQEFINLLIHSGYSHN